MKYYVATLMAMMASATPAWADLACGSLRMPAAQLKEVTRGISSYHSGLDLIAPHGSPARAAAGGTIIAAQTYFAYGLIVDISHGNGVVTRYAHLSGFAPGIRPGAVVEAGQVIGQVGRTGRATTAHIHFEVRLNGRPVDPKPYLALAACTPRTPTVQFEMVQAPRAAPGPPAPEVAAAPAAGSRRVGNGRADRDAPMLRAAPAPRAPIDARPGGLLD